MSNVRKPKINNMKAVSTNKLDLKKMITHHFPLDEIEHAYQVFLNGAKEKAMKIILKVSE